MYEKELYKIKYKLFTKDKLKLKSLYGSKYIHSYNTITGILR